MNAPRINFAKRFANAKGDHEEAAHFVNARPMRTQAKRSLVRARRRLSRRLCVVLA